MRNIEIVVSIVADVPNELAAAYDRYANPLFKYCRTFFSNPADAADAVQVTFVIAASRLDGLREPERAWLYAVARNECLRIARSKTGTSALDQAPDVTDSLDVSEDAERAELRALFEDAAAGLNPGEREVLELQLRHGLEAREVAAVLGVSRKHVHRLLSRARDQLEACLGALLVGRAGRAECGELSEMLAGWDGRLTVQLRKRVHRHIGRCPTCTARRTFELRPAMLLDRSPAAAMAAGAAESFRVALGAPSELKAHTIALATGRGPGAAAHATAVLTRAGNFGRHGFPKPAPGAKGLAGPHGAGRVKALRYSSQGQAAAAAAVAIAVAIAAVAFALTGNNERLAPSTDRKPPHSVPPTPPGSPGAGPTTGQPPPPTRGPAAQTVAPTSGKEAPASGRMSAASATPRAPTVTGPAASTNPTTSATARRPPTPPSRPAPGTLSVVPGGGTLIVVPGLFGSLVSLRASGGTVDWTVSVANDPDHLISVSPAAAGTLTPAAPTTTLRITISQFVQCGRGTTTRCPTVTVSPGGTAFDVRAGWIPPFPSGGPRPSNLPSTLSATRPSPRGGTPTVTHRRRITIR
jgi:RNA polymerase sigma factor (sigma-70 family)